MEVKLNNFSLVMLTITIVVLIICAVMVFTVEPVSLSNSLTLTGEDARQWGIAYGNYIRGMS